MKRLYIHRAPGVTGWRGTKGQAITELALLAPVLAIMLLGIVEIAGAYGAQTNLRNAVFQAVRVGALRGNGGLTSFTCPNTTSGITDTVDMGIVQTILGAQGVNSSNIASIQVYKAGVNPGTIAYTGTTQELNQYVYPFISGTNLISSTYNWPSCLRQSSEPADALAVHLTYRYHPIIPLFGNNTITLNQTSVVRLNPTQTDNPCPVPEAPTDVSAHWVGPEPSTTDAITWTAVSNATGYKVYANVNGNGVGNTPVAVVTSPPSSGPVSTNYTFSPTYPAASQVSYQVRGYNGCPSANGDVSDPVPDGQYALPITPTIITATAAITPGYDYLSWTSVPDAQLYTITQTASTGNQAVITTAAPLTSTVIADPYHNPPVSSVTYAVAATSQSTVQAPSATAVITTGAAPLVTVDDAVTSTTSTNFKFTYGSGNQWVACGPATTGPTSCASTTGVQATGLYSNTLTLTSHAGDTITIPFTGTQIMLYGALQKNGANAAVTLDGVNLPNIDFYSSTSVGNTPVFTSTLSGVAPAAHTLTLTILSSHNASSTPTGGKYYVGIDRAVVQQ